MEIYDLILTVFHYKITNIHQEETQEPKIQILKRKTFFNINNNGPDKKM